MRKLLVALLVLVCFNASSQRLQFDNTYGRHFNRLLVDSLFGIPADTFSVPAFYASKSWVARKGGNLYYWNGTAWLKMGSGTYTAGGVDSVKVISDSVLVQYYGATPDTISTFQRYTITSPQHGQILKYDSTTKSWKNVDFTGAAVDSIREFTGDFPATGNIGLNIDIHRIQYRSINGEDTIVYTLAVQDSTIYSSPAELVDITFPSSHASHYVNTSGVITNIGNCYCYGCTALSSLSLAADGWIQFQWNTGDKNAFLGFNDVNSAIYYTGMEAGMLVSPDGWVYRVEGGTYASTGLQIANGNLVRISRVGSALTLDKSTDGGDNWTTLYNFTYTSSGTLYIVADLYEDAGTVMRYPKLYQ